MGQAKRRGSFEQRKEQAIQRRNAFIEASTQKRSQEIAANPTQRRKAPPVAVAALIAMAMWSNM